MQHLFARIMTMGMRVSYSSLLRTSGQHKLPQQLMVDAASCGRCCCTRDCFCFFLAKVPSEAPRDLICGFPDKARQFCPCSLYIRRLGTERWRLLFSCALLVDACYDRRMNSDVLAEICSEGRCSLTYEFLLLEIFNILGIPRSWDCSSCTSICILKSVFWRDIRRDP